MINIFFDEKTRKIIRKETGKATSEMLASMKNNDLTRDEMNEWYGYIRAMRDVVYMFNCQENGQYQASNDLEEAYKLLTNK